MSVKIIKTVVVEFDTFSEWDFVPPGSFYIRPATGDYLFLKTSDRKAAQDFVNNEYGVGKYSVIPTKDQKTKSRLESGGLSCTGTATRRGQQKR
ncbi:hypothetical protein MT_57010 [Pseudomonas phage phiPto-bp6g]|nr:hypothetical protein MT_57010 [Pseudomonas phage phiPto-bp6g]